MFIVNEKGRDLTFGPIGTQLRASAVFFNQGVSTRRIQTKIGCLWQCVYHNMLG
jgi:hypothetical protein